MSISDLQRFTQAITGTTPASWRNPRQDWFDIKSINVIFAAPVTDATVDIAVTGVGTVATLTASGTVFQFDMQGERYRPLQGGETITITSSDATNSTAEINGVMVDP